MVFLLTYSHSLSHYEEIWMSDWLYDEAQSQKQCLEVTDDIYSSCKYNSEAKYHDYSLEYSLILNAQWTSEWAEDSHFFSSLRL